MIHKMWLTEVIDKMEHWWCPECKREFLMSWPPEYKKKILNEGDQTVAHTGSKGGVEMGVKIK